MFARRIAQIPASPTVALNNKAKELTAAGHEVFNFTIGEPDFPTPHPVVDAAIIALKKGRTKYGSPGGGKELRQAFAEKMQRENNIQFDADEVVCGMGAKELLFHIALAFLDEGDKAVMTAPYWVSYTAHVRAAGAEAIELPVPEDFPNCKIDFEKLDQTLGQNQVKLVYLNSPNNPAGYVLDDSDLRKFAAIMQKHPHTWIISDEIYEYLTYVGSHRSILNVAPELKSRTILVHGLAKNFAMTGWRVGFAAAPKAVAKVLNNLQSQSSTCLPGFIEDAATFALRQGREMMVNELATFARRRELVMELATTIPHCKPVQPNGAFYLFLDFRALFARSQTVKNSMELASHLLEKDFIATVPGEAFGAPGFIRLSFAASETVLIAGLTKLRDSIHKLATN